MAYINYTKNELKILFCFEDGKLSGTMFQALDQITFFGLCGNIKLDKTLLLETSFQTVFLPRQGDCRGK